MIRIHRVVQNMSTKALGEGNFCRIPIITFLPANHEDKRAEEVFSPSSSSRKLYIFTFSQNLIIINQLKSVPVLDLPPPYAVLYSLYSK